MKRFFTLLSLVCTAMIIGCATVSGGDVSPGVVADSSGTKACCSASASRADASPGAVSGEKTAAQCSYSGKTVSPGAVSGCSGKPASQCSSKSDSDTVSPGAVSGRGCSKKSGSN